MIIQYKILITILIIDVSDRIRDAPGVVVDDEGTVALLRRREVLVALELLSGQ